MLGLSHPFPPSNCQIYWDFLHSFTHSSLCCDLFNPDSFRLVELCFLCPERHFFICVSGSTNNLQYVNIGGGNVSFEKNHQSETIKYLQRRIFVTEAVKLSESNCIISTHFLFTSLKITHIIYFRQFSLNINVTSNTTRKYNPLMLFFQV